MSDLPPGWEWVTLGDINWPSYTRETPAHNDSRPYLGMEGLESGTGRIIRTGQAGSFTSSAPVVKPGYTVYGRLRPYLNKVTTVSFDGYCSGEFICLPPRAWLADRYLQYRLLSDDFVQFTSSLNTGDRPRVKWEQIAQFKMAFPPLCEQQRIVAALEDHLSRLDAGLGQVKVGRRRLESLSKRVIVEAVPVPGPKQWRYLTVGEAGQVDLGRQRHPDWHIGPHMRPYLRVANVFEDRIDVKDVKEMDFPPDLFDRFKLQPGDILLNEGQSPEYLGRPAMYRGKRDKYAFTNSLLRFRARPDVLPEWALLVFRRHMHAQRFIKEVRITTNIAHLSATRFKSVEFPIPPLDEQEQIVKGTKELLDDITRMSGALHTAGRRAEKLRNSVLSEAFAGQLVPQDPHDEPASVLLERVRAERNGQLKPTRGRRTKNANVETLL